MPMISPITRSRTPSSRLCAACMSGHQVESTAVGNCAEGDFSVEDVAEALRIVQQAAPSLRVKVHCGGDYEDKTCVATINVTETGVSVDPPEVSEIPEISQAQIMGRLFAAMHL